MSGVRSLAFVLMVIFLGFVHALLGLYVEPPMLLLTWLPIAGILAFAADDSDEGAWSRRTRRRVVAARLTALVAGYGWILLIYVYDVCDRVVCV